MEKIGIGLLVVTLLGGCGAHQRHRYQDDPCFGVEGATNISGSGAVTVCPDVAQWPADNYQGETE